jgi:ribosomal protein S4
MLVNIKRKEAKEKAVFIEPAPPITIRHTYPSIKNGMEHDSDSSHTGSQ